ncbi:hypothetical protein F4818DRAFT_83284 [Hypoxylon cercidicola]|nr:hypothetical protein F4818DRAFT_83284 [Hypoxylon cercidicola]
MMNETDVAAFEPVPTLVNPPSTHGLIPTGVMSIDQTSCKARRIPFPSSTNYKPSTSSTSSRVAKTNRPRDNGGSASSSSSLARAAVRKRRKTAADAPVVTPTIPATATADGLRTKESRWDYPFLPGSPSYDGELLDTKPGARDHFTLSSPVSQTQGLDLCYFPCSDPVQFDLSSLPLSSPFHTPIPYLTAHENFSQGISLMSYSTDYPAITTQPFNNYALDYPLYPPFDLVNTPTMLIVGDTTCAGRQLPHESDPPCAVKRESSGGNTIREERDKLDEVVSNPSNYDRARRDARHTNGDTDVLLDGPYESMSLQIKYDVATDENRPFCQSEKSEKSEKPSKTLEDEERRKMTAKTRKLKACIRCRMQKLKCIPDPEDEGQDCLTCRRINLDSKKVIHRLQCLRWKLAEVVLFREGGLDLTRRWTGLKVKDLGPKDWASDQIRTIKVTIGYCGKPLELLVRKFKPNKTDVTWKNWVDKTGAKRCFNIEPYALASTRNTSQSYKRYVMDYASSALIEYSDNLRVHPVVRETYKAAKLYVTRLGNRPSEVKGEDVRPGEFLKQYFYLWFAIRNTLGSAFIVGNDRLDMKPVDDPECPYYQTISIPRMIPAQFDSLGNADILAPNRKQILEGLWKMMASKNPHHFFTIYLTVFMLLHEVSVTSADRLRRARDNKIERYDLASFVEGLQEGANIILSHWHYYKRNVDDWIMDVNSENKEQKNAVWGELEPDEVQLLVRTREVYLARAEMGRLEPMDWEDDLYFVSQMFGEGWQPKPTFSS